MSDNLPLTIDCGPHGTRTAAVVCRHMIGEDQSNAGFIENNSDTDDLQAWCYECEAMFAREGGMTDAFRAFNGMTVVCDHCYEGIRSRHSRPEN